MKKVIFSLLTWETFTAFYPQNSNLLYIYDSQKQNIDDGNWKNNNVFQTANNYLYPHDQISYQNQNSNSYSRSNLGDKSLQSTQNQYDQNTYKQNFGDDKFTFGNTYSSSNYQLNTNNILSSTAKIPLTVKSATYSQFVNSKGVDREKTIVFENAITTNKAIANLLDIVEKLKGNISSAKKEIPIYEDRLNQAITKQRQIQSQVIDIQNNKKNLSQVQQKTKDQLKNAQLELQQLKDNQSLKANELKYKQNTIIESENKLKNLQKELQRLNQKLNYLQAQSKTNQVNLKATNIQIQNNKQQLKKLNLELKTIEETIQSSKKQITDSEFYIEQLKQELKKSQQKLYKDKQKLNELINKKDKGPAMLKQLENKITSQSTQALRNINTITNDITNQIKQTMNTIDTIMKDINNSDANLKSHKTQIVPLKNNIINIQKAIAQRQKTIKNNLDTLISLQAKVPLIQKEMIRIYYESNDINALVNNAKNNLDSLVKRLTSDTQMMLYATDNLQKVRSQKQKADTNMNELLQQRSSALPYAQTENVQTLIPTTQQRLKQYYDSQQNQFEIQLTSKNLQNQQQNTNSNLNLNFKKQNIFNALSGGINLNELNRQQQILDSKNYW